MNKLPLAAVGGLLLVLSISSTALAETCKIKDWRWTTVANRSFVKVEGETTCRDGVFYFRQYWVLPDKVKFAGTATAMINGYTFVALFDTVDSMPSGSLSSVTMRIKFDYKPSFLD